MKKIFLLFTLIITINSIAQTDAFPGAEGWGRYAKGGRGGVLLLVTNLNDSGPGSFREAAMFNGPRTIVFKVSGNIELKSKLIISSPFLTIAGQTAPGEGICLKNYPLEIFYTHDIIVRGIRVRPGTESGIIGSEIDGINIAESSNVIVDHCSVSWTCDEGVNNWHKSSFITFQWCLIAEPLNNSVHEKGKHGFGATIGGYKSTFHHNIIANATARNPSIGGNNQNPTVMLDVRNCVFSNWKNRSCDGKPLSVNIVNNYYKPGPATLEDVKSRIVRIDNSEKYGFNSLWYIDGNYIEGNPIVSKDNWNGGVEFEEGTSEQRNRLLKAVEYAPVSTQTAEEAYTMVLKNAGVIYPVRDKQDCRVISQIVTGKYQLSEEGIIDKVEQAGGWPQLSSAIPDKDTDEDGMPDSWEVQNGLNPKDPNDSGKISDLSAYTNLEKYINSLIPAAY